MRRSQIGCLRLAIVMAVAWGCANEPPAVETHDRVGAVAIAVTPALSPALSPAAAVDGDRVQGWTGPGGASFEATRRTGSGAHLYRQIGTKMFALPLRTSARPLTQYPCTSCHEGASVTPGTVTGRHENIKSVHPKLTDGACTTCHVAGAVDRLALPGGQRGTLDQPYRLCAQCHFPQVDAWAAGGHGKRLDGWAGRRVVMNCTDCHDPHVPYTERRIPFPGPQLPRVPGGFIE